ncbi:S9 family peptidase [Psychroflexus planctonicus]|uniref:Peptidase S9 n=1 Tax=Psychroflexus planctonicus TaxID=1526575 RepID=A0ABQ1SG44_9FLAO|nr:S9 family peptidase [Psychroflexus planctonicus]GGE38395.1 peptidase S9 [Psychroflexus planctonicus]
MYKKQVWFYVLFIVSCSLLAQKKQVSLEDIWGGTFRANYMQSLQSLSNGTEYIVQEYDRASAEMKVEVYNYKTGEKVRTLFSSKDMDGLPGFQTFSLSKNEDKVLLGNQIERIFRRSTKGIYHVYDLNTKKLTPVSSEVIQSTHFSPDGKKVGFVLDNNLFYKDLVSNENIQVTEDGKVNEIINGITDWVYEEEFSLVRAFDWNKNATQIAFIRFDEAEVPEFSMDMYGTYGNDLYPSQEVFKYPKAGEANAEVSLHIYDVASKETHKIDLGEYEYIPRLQWTKDANTLSVQTTNRHQNEVKLHFVDAKTYQAKPILTEADEAYVDVDFDLTFLADNSFIWTSEKDGWNHIYHYEADGKLKNQITKGNWEVTNYYGYDADSNRIFYQSTENGSVNRGVYSINAKGKSKRELATNEGTNSASFSADFTYFINTFQSVEQPSTYTLHEAKKGKEIRLIEDNQELLDKVNEYDFSPKEISTIEVNGNELNMWMVKPSDFDPSKKYPLLMYQYSGPGSQSVANTFYGANDYWYQMLANQGYIIACVDGRGTGLKGRDFKKVTQKELGKLELEDQTEAAKILGNEPWIDLDRIGIWGWSYGGFMASNAIFQSNDVFSTAIAVAPVTSWRFYDTIYTERYMTTPQENPSGYDSNSPISHVNKLKGNYLLIHGGGDDNVHVQNSMQLIEALIQANKQFDWRIYPDKDHGIYGGNTRLHLYNLMTDFLLENL